MIGRTLFHYKILDKLGSGGMGRSTSPKTRSSVGGEFRAETPRALFNLPERHRADWVLEMSPDGERFLILIETGEDPSPTELHVTTNGSQS